VAKRKKTSIRILNAADGQGFTSRKTADRYIGRGVAIIGKDASGEYLEFKSTGPAAHVAAAVLREIDIGYALAAENGLASLDAIRRLPIAGDPLRLLMIMSKVTKPMREVA
jgi:hypothetical protein